MSEKLHEVTQYHVSGGGLEISYTGRGTKDDEFIYKDKDGERQFSGKSIYHDDTQLGLIVSVTLEHAPDSHTEWFSLAVPAANIPDNSKSIDIATFGVRTIERTSKAGPDLVEGQIQTYETYQLEGNGW